MKCAPRQAQQERAQERRGHRRQSTLTAEAKQKAVAKERNRRRRATRLKAKRAYQANHGVDQNQRPPPLITLETPVMSNHPVHAGSFRHLGKNAEDRGYKMDIKKPACHKGTGGQLLDDACKEGRCECQHQQWMLMATGSKNATKADVALANQRAEEYAKEQGIPARRLPEQLLRATIYAIGLFENTNKSGVWGQDDGDNYTWRAVRVAEFSSKQRDVKSHQGKPVALRLKDDAVKRMNHMNDAIKSGAYKWLC